MAGRRVKFGDLYVDPDVFPKPKDKLLDFIYESVDYFGSNRMKWSLKGPRGMVIIWAIIANGEDEAIYNHVGGIELVHLKKPEYLLRFDKPLNNPSITLGSTCWYDGHSMSFDDYVGPLIPVSHEPGTADHMGIMAVCEKLYNQKIEI